MDFALDVKRWNFLNRNETQKLFRVTHFTSAHQYNSNTPCKYPWQIS